MQRTITSSFASYRPGSLRRRSVGDLKPLTRGVEQRFGVALLLGLLSCSLGSAVFAAVPVEDMSTRDVRPQVTTPQPILPGGLQPGDQPSQGGQAAPGGATTATALRTPQPITARPDANPISSGGRPAGQNAQLFYEVQTLQSELQQLRGLLEDQAYEIARLRDLQRSQYLDMDRRLTDSGRPGRPGGLVGGLVGGESDRAGAVAGNSASGSAAQAEAAESSGSQSGGGPATSVVVQTGSGATLPQSGEAATSTQSGAVVVAATEPAGAVSSEPMTEQGSYTYAFELMKDQQFEQSIGAYQMVVENWPDGKYAPESRYWLGELYLMSDRLEDARGSFNQVVKVFPAHQKVPLSLYKLGVVNHRLGVTPKALEYLDDVVVRYPDTPAAGLARTYAAELR